MLAHVLLGRAFFEADKEALVRGVNLIMKIAVKLLNKKSAKRKPQLLEDDQGSSLKDG